VGPLLLLIVRIGHPGLRLALAVQGQRAVMDLDLDLVWGEARQFSLQDEGLIGLIEIHRWDPRADAPGGLLAIAAAEELIEKLVYLALKRREILHRRPWNECHGGVLPLSITSALRTPSFYLREHIYNLSVRLSSYILAHQSYLKPLLSGWLSEDGRQSMRSDGIDTGVPT